MIHLWEKLSFLVIALSMVSAAPSEVHRRDAHFKVYRQPTGAIRVRDGTAELARAFAKYGWSMPEDIGVANNNVTKNVVNVERDVSAKPGEGDAEFLCPVDVGGQKFMMDFDTGSSDMWLFNTQLSSADTKGHDVYDPSKSKTFTKMPGASFAVHYGDGSFVSGPVGQDSVSIGGANVPSQAIGLPDKIASDFVEDVHRAGLLGLGFHNRIKPTPQNTFFENVQSSLKRPVFTVNLKHSTVGAYEFGNVDQTQFVGKLAVTPVNTSAGFWQLTSKKFQVGDGGGFENLAASPAIADTGTSLMIMDPVVVQKYYEQVPGAKQSANGGSMVVPCNAQLPDLHIELAENYMGTIPGPLFNYDQVGNGYCLGGLQSNKGGGMQVFGDLMFKSQFVVFDGEGPKLWFAPHR